MHYMLLYMAERYAPEDNLAVPQGAGEFALLERILRTGKPKWARRWTINHNCNMKGCWNKATAGAVCVWYIFG